MRVNHIIIRLVCDDKYKTTEGHMDVGYYILLLGLLCKRPTIVFKKVTIYKMVTLYDSFELFQFLMQ